MSFIDVGDNCPSMFGFDARKYKQGFTKKPELERKIRIYRFKEK